VTILDQRSDDAPLDAAAMFDRAWETLPRPERRVIETIVREGLTVSRCASRLGLGVEEARRLAARGLRTLRLANSMDRPR
jgi:DNA-directed RNA polymerase specialized sigma24 family protein